MEVDTTEEQEWEDEVGNGNVLCVFSDVSICVISQMILLVELKGLPNSEEPIPACRDTCTLLVGL